MIGFVECEPKEATHATFAGKTYVRFPGDGEYKCFIESERTVFNLDTHEQGVISKSLYGGAGVKFWKKAPPKKYEFKSEIWLFENGALLGLTSPAGFDLPGGARVNITIEEDSNEN